ncbi:hypothetical protein E2C01_007555 [Portunus trituberculatus]|uniref:Uncharacterized protein n=1 Tax=Portunus trituberculatus TaxID=210409 RepID=A0A5B7CZB5_PORTR|nr:hypothetical protein [Portunus trituberculatus]
MEHLTGSHQRIHSLLSFPSLSLLCSSIGVLLPVPSVSSPFLLPALEEKKNYRFLQSSHPVCNFGFAFTGFLLSVAARTVSQQQGSREAGASVTEATACKGDALLLVKVECTWQFFKTFVP